MESNEAWVEIPIHRLHRSHTRIQLEVENERFDVELIKFDVGCSLLANFRIPSKDLVITLRGNHRCWVLAQEEVDRQQREIRRLLEKLKSYEMQKTAMSP